MPGELQVRGLLGSDALLGLSKGAVVGEADCGLLYCLPLPTLRSVLAIPRAGALGG